MGDFANKPSHDPKDYILTEAGYVKKQGENPDAQHVLPLKPTAEAGRRMEEATKKVSTFQSVLDARKFPIERQIDETITTVIAGIESKANALKDADMGQANAGLAMARQEVVSMASDALKDALKDINDKPVIAQQPTPGVVDALVTIGKANRDNQDPAIQADVQALRALVIEMQGKLAAQPANAPAQMPNIVINNNLAPQNGPQQPGQAPEKKEEQKNWKEQGASLVNQANKRAEARVAFGTIWKEIQAGRPVPQNLMQYLGRSDFDQLSPNDQKKHITDISSTNKRLLELQVKQINSLVENAMKVSPDRNVIAATTEEANLAMDQWMSGYAAFSSMVARMPNAKYKIS